MIKARPEGVVLSFQLSVFHSCFLVVCSQMEEEGEIDGDCFQVDCSSRRDAGRVCQRAICAGADTRASEAGGRLPGAGGSEGEAAGAGETAEGLAGSRALSGCQCRRGGSSEE